MKLLLSIVLGFTCGLFPNLRKKGIDIYQVKQPHPDLTSPVKPACYYCFDPAPEELFAEPLVSESAIIDFDWDQQKIKLMEEAQKKINALTIPLQGLLVAMGVNGKLCMGLGMPCHHSVAIAYTRIQKMALRLNLAFQPAIPTGKIPDLMIE